MSNLSDYLDGLVPSHEKIASPDLSHLSLSDLEELMGIKSAEEIVYSGHVHNGVPKHPGWPRAALGVDSANRPATPEEKREHSKTVTPDIAHTTPKQTGEPFVGKFANHFTEQEFNEMRAGLVKLRNEKKIRVQEGGFGGWVAGSAVSALERDIKSLDDNRHKMIKKAKELLPEYESLPWHKRHREGLGATAGAGLGLAAGSALGGRSGGLDGRVLGGLLGTILGAHGGGAVGRALLSNKDYLSILHQDRHDLQQDLAEYGRKLSPEALDGLRGLREHADEKIREVKAKIKKANLATAAARGLAHAPPIPAAARAVRPAGGVFAPAPGPSPFMGLGAAQKLAPARPLPANSMQTPQFLARQPGGTGMLEAVGAVNEISRMPGKAQSLALGKRMGIGSDVAAHRAHLANTQGMTHLASIDLAELFAKLAGTLDPAVTSRARDFMTQVTKQHSLVRSAIPDMETTGARIRAAAAQRASMAGHGAQMPVSHTPVSGTAPTLPAPGQRPGAALPGSSRRRPAWAPPPSLGSFDTPASQAATIAARPR